MTFNSNQLWVLILHTLPDSLTFRERKKFFRACQFHSMAAIRTDGLSAGLAPKFSNPKIRFYKALEIRYMQKLSGSVDSAFYGKVI